MAGERLPQRAVLFQNWRFGSVASTASAEVCEVYTARMEYFPHGSETPAISIASNR